MSTINVFTHSLRAYLASIGSPLPLGHTHQLLAAGRGYNSLAALQASDELEDLDRSMHWLVDVPKLEERAISLGITLHTETFIKSLARASRECSGPHIHASDANLADAFVVEVQEAAVHDSAVAQEMANTNCTGPSEAYLEFTGSSIGANIGADSTIEIGFEGEVQGEQDLDRPYSGHSVRVTVVLRLQAIGRRLFVGPPEIQILDSILDQGYYGEDFDETPSTFSQLEAIAIELGIPVEEHEQLEGAEVDGHTTRADVAIGYLINIAHCASSPLINRLRQKYPTQQIWVLGNTLEHARQPD